MFGYITINKSEMKFKEFDVYHSYYCGLCRVLKEKYGVPGQLALSYDLTFLLMLLSSLYEPETTRGACRCIAHPQEKHETRINELTEYVADMNVLFALYKCNDDWEDERKLTKYLYGRMLERKRGRLKELYGEKLRAITLLMQTFTEKERSGDADIDTMAGLFGQVMAEVVCPREDEWSENLRRLGFFLGKFIYICDAYEDVETDLRKGTFNPLKTRYGEPDFEEQSREILTMMISECCREFEKLPIIENVEILRNILYSGVWMRYEAVHANRTRNVSESHAKRTQKPEMEQS